MSDPVTIRRSSDSDVRQLREVAELDNRRLPSPPFLVAEVRGEIVAALSIESGITVANPFRETADLVTLLRLRADQLAYTICPGRTGLRRFRIVRAAVHP
jgi:hypothetical protein